MPQVYQTNGVWIIQILLASFLAILFLQSGLDKVIDRDGNRDWLAAHFEKSPLAKYVNLLFPAITALEVGAGVLSGVGVIMLVLTKSTSIAFYGAVLSGLSFVSLFFGQRLAKDYPGASGIVGYFLVGIAAIWFLG